MAYERWSKMEQAIAKKQYGFRKGASTEAAMLKLIKIVQHALQNRNHAIRCILDKKRTFGPSAKLKLKQQSVTLTRYMIW